MNRKLQFFKNLIQQRSVIAWVLSVLSIVLITLHVDCVENGEVSVYLYPSLISALVGILQVTIYKYSNPNISNDLKNLRRRVVKQLNFILIILSLIFFHLIYASSYMDFKGIEDYFKSINFLDAYLLLLAICFLVGFLSSIAIIREISEIDKKIKRADARK